MKCEYLTVNTNYLLDRNLSLEAKGLLSEINLYSDNINSIEDLLEIPHIEDKNTLLAILNELEETGYLTITEVGEEDN